MALAPELQCTRLFMYRDAIVLQHRIEVASASIQLVAVDDLLLAFHARTGQAMIVDVAAEIAVFNSLSVELPEAEDVRIRHLIVCSKAGSLRPS